MRDIKFRAWDKQTKRLFQVQTLQFYGANNTVDACWTNGVDFDGESTLGEPELNNLHNLELMQYTGLKDKKGVEIFEGDVLFHPLQGRRKVFYPYSERVASYGLRDIDSGFGSTLQDSHAVWEVIGNVWEDGDLIDSERTKTY